MFQQQLDNIEILITRERLDMRQDIENLVDLGSTYTGVVLPVVILGPVTKIQR
jgi:hypothetical protein